MLNALTIDVEDWRQLVYSKVTGKTIPPSEKVIKETEFILNTLASFNVRATFFVLSNVARTFPELIRRIDEEGHEIASHGYSHCLVYNQSTEVFLDETRQARRLLESIIRKRIRGYRAAEFSITKESWWALEILAQEGFTYDSSIFPICGKRYGVPDFSLDIRRIQTSRNKGILEVPLTVIEGLGQRWPLGGGGYLRLIPYWLTRRLIRKVNQEGRSAVVYLHPYEFTHNRSPVALTDVSLRKLPVLARYLTIHNCACKLVRDRFFNLLKDFRFAPITEVIQNV